MRDPKRIPKVLKVIERYWSMHPDLRLGQLISIANGTHRARQNLPHSDDVFNIEDDDLLQIIHDELL